MASMEDRRRSRERGRARAVARGLVALALGASVLALSCASLSERVHLSTGNKLYNAQKFEDAIKEYAKILQVAPDHWEANYMTAISYLAMYHPGSTHAKDREYAEKAIETFEHLLTLNPPDEETREKVRGFYVTLLTQTEKTDKAIEFFEGLLASNPGNPGLLAQLAGLCAKQGKFECALENYEKRAMARPDNKEAWYTIGVVCWERSYKGGVLVSTPEREQLVQKGLEALERALAIDPEYKEAIAYVNLLYREQAKVLSDLGRYQEAGLALVKADDYQKKALELLKKAREAETQGKSGA